MAHDLTAGPVLRIHQALHGYARGHQRLSGSVEVRPRDAKTMLVLSDISGPGVRPGDDGYLTGYPISESGLYVLARTWAAPEMPRPGCVWTHSLLIDFADLATLADPAGLLALFRRPEPGDFSSYARTLTLKTDQVARQLLGSQSVDFARRIASGLYEKAKSRIIASRPHDADADQIVIAVWAQQWPRLRRAFRFCTLAGAERAADGGFDLQLVGGERSIRSRFADAIDIGSVDPVQAAWLDDVIGDFVAPDSRGLRTFMRRAGGDLDSGREAFAPICRLHVLTMAFGKDPYAIPEAVRLIHEQLGSSDARTARGLVTTEALKQSSLNDVSLDFVLSGLDLADEAAVTEYKGQLGAQIWRRDPARLAKMLAGGERERTIADGAFGSLTEEELLAGAVRSPELASLVIARKPDLVVAPGFWSARSIASDGVFALLPGRPDLAAPAVAAMIEGGRDDLARKAITALGGPLVLGVLAACWQTRDSGASLRWLKAACADAGAVAEFFGTASSVPGEMLVAIAKSTLPDAVPNDYGNDPWLRILASSTPTYAEMDTYLASYLLARSLGWRSRNPAELVQYGFDAVYGALSRDRLPEHAWRLLEDRLPWVLPLLSWDRCLRARNAIAALFVDRNLPPAVFARVSEDDTYFAHLVNAAARTYRGRDYLNRVRVELGTETEKYASRRRVVDDLVDRR
jgi:hypothetical protein